ncbi:MULTISPECIES: aminoglycoside adenylyltransferase domain-containing protein [unclassified Nonomuraea]|uniref:nucleotidyltransferase domain-containing protein n=1 Tax=unclassified Nonomuraea TaxID=2593643 RepID=UPI0033DE06B4
MLDDLPDIPSRLCRDYLALADRHAPGLIEGLYLQGSIALGDYRPQLSDVDFVAVTSRSPDPAVLRTIHAELRPSGAKPHFDGLYVTWDDLRKDPAQAPDGPSVREWRLTESGRAERHLVTWHVLAQSGVAVRGPAAAQLGIHTDWDTLARTTRENLATYWTRWVQRSARRISWPGVAALSDYQTTWGVLGIARLRQTLAVGEVTSKSAAGEYALEAFHERWHRIVREALRIRQGGPALYRNPFRRRADLLAFMTMILEM